MSARKPGNGEKGIHDVNMTPLIDVSLVLVVILMVATPMAFQSSIAVRNLAAAGRAGPQLARPERVEVTILSEDSVRVNRTVLPRAALEGRLQSLLNATATRQVVVRCADVVPHGVFVGVLDDAKRCGAAQIAVVGR